MFELISLLPDLLLLLLLMSWFHRHESQRLEKTETWEEKQHQAFCWQMFWQEQTDLWRLFLSINRGYVPINPLICDTAVTQTGLCQRLWTLWPWRMHVPMNSHSNAPIGHKPIQRQWDQIQREIDCEAFQNIRIGDAGDDLWWLMESWNVTQEHAGVVSEQRRATQPTPAGKPTGGNRNTGHLKSAICSAVLSQPGASSYDSWEQTGLSVMS